MLFQYTFESTEGELFCSACLACAPEKGLFIMARDLERMAAMRVDRKIQCCTCETVLCRVENPFASRPAPLTRSV